MTQTTIRLGKLDTEEMLPSIRALYDEAEDVGVLGGDEGYRFSEEEEVDEDGRYLYLYYTQEVGEERRQVQEGEENEEEIEVRISESKFARSIRFLLREDGYYAFESTRGVYGEDAIKYLLENLDISGVDCRRREAFPRKWMRSFYSTTHNIRKVKLKEIGGKESEERDFDQKLQEWVAGAGGPAQRMEFSTSGRDNNLRGSELVDALVRMSEIDFVSGKDDEGEITKLTRNGRLTFSYPADLDHAGQAERMYDATKRILGQIDEE